MKSTAADVGLTQYTAEHPLLLWTDLSPTHGGGGAVVIRSLLSDADREKILWASPNLRDARSDPRLVALRAGSAVRASRRSLLLDSTFLAKSLADETLRIAQARGAKAVWIVLHGAAVPVAAELVRRGQLPVHVTVHDDPAFAVALRSRRYLALTPWIQHQFRRALRGAASVDVIGEGMQTRYKKRYGVDSVVVHRGVAGPVAASRPYDGAANGLRIGVLGNTYSYGQLPVLGRAVARASRALGVQGRITMIGQGFADRLRADLAGTGVEVESTGHVDETKAVEVLRSCFVLYLNYPFSMRDAVLRETSFPTKFGTYVLAARPILAHAPEKTTLAPLSSRTDYVHPWTTMSEADGGALLTRLWRTPSTMASAHEAAETMRRRYFDVERNRQTMARLLDALLTTPPARTEAL